MIFKPHPYQREAIQWGLDHKKCGLLLPMGAGKTVCTLTIIQRLMYIDVSRVLIIGPVRVVQSTWPDEIKQWEHTRDLSYTIIDGPMAKGKKHVDLSTDLYLIGKENVADLIETYQRDWPFDMVVIDELSSFKNHSSQRWKALRKVRPKIRRMVGLTGTPAGGGLMDLWAETYLIDNGERLGRFIGRYREAYFKADGMNPYTGVVYSYVPLPGAEERIYHKISDISVSMKALDYLDMPKFVPVVHRVDMEPQERKLYEELKKELLVEVDGENIDAANAAVLSGKLLQMANGAIYNDSREVIPVHRQKLLMLEDLIEQANGQNVLVAYWYQHDRSRILEFLTEKGYQPRDIKTEADISEWNAGHIQVGLISPAGAGHGLNIQRGGHILIWFSMIWSLEMYQQTNARLWRQGQKEVVTAHHIVCRDTVDEDVLKALEHKDTTQQNLIAAVKAHLTI